MQAFCPFTLHNPQLLDVVAVGGVLEFQGLCSCRHELELRIILAQKINKKKFWDTLSGRPVALNNLFFN